MSSWWCRRGDVVMVISSWGCRHGDVVRCLRWSLTSPTANWTLLSGLWRKTIRKDLVSPKPTRITSECGGGGVIWPVCGRGICCNVQCPFVFAPPSPSRPTRAAVGTLTAALWFAGRWPGSDSWCEPVLPASSQHWDWKYQSVIPILTIHTHIPRGLGVSLNHVMPLIHLSAFF